MLIQTGEEFSSETINAGKQRTRKGSNNLVTSDRRICRQTKALVQQVSPLLEQVGHSVRIGEGNKHLLGVAHYRFRYSLLLL